MKINVATNGMTNVTHLKVNTGAASWSSQPCAEWIHSVSISLNLDDLAHTYRFWPIPPITTHSKDYYKLTPEERKATDVHEDVHR